MIPNQVILNFDPEKIEDEKLRRVFADDLARTIWMGWRVNHIVSQDFNDEVLRLAEMVREEKPRLWESLRRLGMRLGPYSNFAGTKEDECWRELLPYVAGEKACLTYRLSVEIEG